MHFELNNRSTLVALKSLSCKEVLIIVGSLISLFSLFFIVSIIPALFNYYDNTLLNIVKDTSFASLRTIIYIIVYIYLYNINNST